MARFSTVISAVVFTSSLLAQGSIGSPKGFNNVEGGDFSHLFGRYADGRFQFAEGDFKGQALSITGLAYRRDYRDPTPETAMGRKWSNVVLEVADCDYDKFSQFWNLNALNTPTRVYSAAVEWPTQTSRPLLKPAIWGGMTGKLGFPFTTPYPFTGKNDLLLDYSFSGGVLANAAPWAFTNARFYYLDGENISTEPRSGLTRGFPPGGSCADSSQPQYPGAASSIEALVYSDAEPNPSYRGKLRVYHETSYTAPTAIILQVVGLSGLPSGTPVGARCNSLYLDLTKPWVPFYRFTDPLGASGRSVGSGEYMIPWNPLVFAGLQIWTQGAWTDTGTKGLALTRAAMVVVPSGKPPAVAPRKKAVYHYMKSLWVAVGPTASHEVNPFFLLWHK